MRVAANRGTGAKESFHGPEDTLRLPTPSHPFLFGVPRRWWWCSRLRVLLPELGNLVHRIRWVLEIRAWELRGIGSHSHFCSNFL